jgi:hypothetical protein
MGARLAKSYLENLEMRRSPRNLRIDYNHRGLTHFGGAYFFHEFRQGLQLDEFLADLACVLPISGRV